MWQDKTIFEADFQRPVNPILVTQKFTKEIEDNTMLRCIEDLDRRKLYTLVGSNLILDGLNSTVMELGTEQVLMWGVVDFFEILMADGSKAMLGSLNM
jgi:hypothetical protein